MSKDKRTRTRSGGNSDKQYSDGGRTTIGDALGVPGHSESCPVGVRERFEESKKRMMASCPQFDEFEKLRVRFYTLRSIIHRSPAFARYDRDRIEYLKVSGAKKDARCQRCEITNPEVMLKAMGGEPEPEVPAGFKVSAMTNSGNGVVKVESAKITQVVAPEAPVNAEAVEKASAEIVAEPEKGSATS